MKFTDKNKRPVALVPDFSGIPAFLRDIPNWVLWGYRWNEAKQNWTKPLFQPSGAHASSTDPSTWNNFSSILTEFHSNLGNFDGVGIVLTPGLGIVGIDLDNMASRTSSGHYTLNNWARRVLELCPGYAEISPSGTGVRIFVKGQLERALKLNNTEIYNSGRYLTITGCVLESPDELPDCTEQIKYIADKLRGAKTPATQEVKTLETDALLQRAFQSRNGSKIQSLYYGDMSGYINSDGQPDRSQADLALCGLLAFWAKGDAFTLDKMFRGSRLYRPKWDERHSGDGQTYGQMTIQKALSGLTEVYSGGDYKIKPARDLSYLDEPPAPAEVANRIIDISDLADAANKLRHEPLSQGIKLSIGEMGHYYRPTKGRMSVITGTPASGKTTLVSEIIRHAVKEHGWKIAIASFETRPLGKLLLNLNRAETGKMPYPGAFTTSMSDQEHFQASSLWKDKIFVFDVAEEDLTIEGVLAYCEKCVKDHNIDGFVLDPWSDLHIPGHLKQSYTHFCREGLNTLRRFTQTRGIHTWLVVHPTKMTTKEHKIAKPNLYSIADSAEFYNKADYGIVVHREDPTGTEVAVYMDKVKFDETGQPGVFYLNWDKYTGRYSGTTSSQVKSTKDRLRSYMDDYLDDD